MDSVHAALFGLCLGDALGVPVEFEPRSRLKANPVRQMMGYGTYNMPPGTWSDDSSMAFCLAESLCEGYDLQDIAERFVRWYKQDHWTPYGSVFDIGISTRRALDRVHGGVSPRDSGNKGVSDNGNGSLMRTLPLIFYLQSITSPAERYRIVAEVSSITHAHPRSVWGCFIYCEYALLLLNGMDKTTALKEMRSVVLPFLQMLNLPEELQAYDRLLGLTDGQTLLLGDQSQMSGSGYVVATLESALWAFLTTDNYSDAVFRAINLGEDTDTTGAVTGGLAGLYYGYQALPEEWLCQLARRHDIERLCRRLSDKFQF